MRRQRSPRKIAVDSAVIPDCRVGAAPLRRPETTEKARGR
jgi:hypothetical protein